MEKPWYLWRTLRKPVWLKYGEKMRLNVAGDQSHRILYCVTMFPRETRNKNADPWSTMLTIIAVKIALLSIYSVLSSVLGILHVSLHLIFTTTYKVAIYYVPIILIG